MLVQWMTINEASAYLSVKKSTLYGMVHRKVIPCYKPTPKTLKFKKDDLDKWIQSGYVPTRRELRENPLAAQLTTTY